MKKGIKAVSIALFLMLFACVSLFVRPKAKAEPTVVTIGSINDWEDFCSSVRDGAYDENTLINLTADLDFDSESSLIRLIGARSGNPFISVFDGKGHTIKGRINLKYTCLIMKLQ